MTENQIELKELFSAGGNWITAEGDIEDSLFRYRPYLSPIVKTKKYIRRVMLILRYEAERDELLPSKVQSKRFAQIEKAVISALEKDFCAVLAFVYTGQEQVVMHFYSSDSIETEKRLMNCIKNIIGTVDFELDCEDDPYWYDYHRVLKRV